MIVLRTEGTNPAFQQGFFYEKLVMMILSDIL